MAYLLGNQAVMESLQSDVQDIQWTINQIISRVGPVPVYSWKFPDRQAGELDIEDLLDLYDCSGDSDEDEERQIAHIALYELVIDRLIFCIQSISKFGVTHLGSILSKNNAPKQDSMIGSVGVLVKDYWKQMNSLQTLYSQMHTESLSKDNRITDLEKMLIKSNYNQNCDPAKGDVASIQIPSTDCIESSTPGMLGLIPPNTADKVLMGISPPEGELCISRNLYSKSTQTYESAFVACESCDIVQKRMKESGDIVIRVCTEQGLPCSLKKFKSQLRIADMIPYNDLCRWMIEQNKDVARIGKQIDILQESINPLKKELKGCETRTRVSEEKAKTAVTNLREEKEIQSALRKQLETKMIEQEKKKQEEVWEEQRQNQLLEQKLNKQKKEHLYVKSQLDEKEKKLDNIELDFKKLKTELKEKCRQIEKHENTFEEMTSIQDKLREVTAQLEDTKKTLAKEVGKSRSVSRNNQNLQGKQQSILSRMEQLGSENTELSDKVATLEEAQISLDERLAELKLENKTLRKKAKANEIIIKNVNKEKEILESSIKATQNAIEELEQKLSDSKERERMIIEYPDLNGPVNPDLQGTGNIVEDMSNQVKANTIRINVLSHQNSELTSSIQKIASLTRAGTYQPAHTPVEPIPLWQQYPSPDSQASHTPQQPDSFRDNHYLNQNHNQHDTIRSQIPAQDNQGPPRVRQHAWTFDSEEERRKNKSSHVSNMTLNIEEEFIVGRSNTPATPKHKKADTVRHKKPSSAKMASYMAPVNSTAIGAYTQMKQALGVLSTKASSKRDRSRPPSGKNCSHITVPGTTSGHEEPTNSPFSCSKCDKMYLKARDLDIHMTYCAH